MSLIRIQIGVIVVIFTIGLLAADAPPSIESSWTSMCPRAEVKRIKDGDTIVADVHFPWSVTLSNQDIRADFDTWEVSRTRRTIQYAPDEIQRGRAASADLSLWLQGRVLYLVPMKDERDGRGRMLAEWWIQKPGSNPERLRDLMKKAGHLRPGSE